MTFSDCLKSLAIISALALCQPVAAKDSVDLQIKQEYTVSIIDAAASQINVGDKSTAERSHMDMFDDAMQAAEQSVFAFTTNVKNYFSERFAAIKRHCLGEEQQLQFMVIANTQNHQLALFEQGNNNNIFSDNIDQITNSALLPLPLPSSSSPAQAAYNLPLGIDSEFTVQPSINDNFEVIYGFDKLDNPHAETSAFKQELGFEIGFRSSL
ncbi:hypothetical protein [Thalassotalea sp. Y01]|uniref:hypothetical protein n=1 Tax=Thalassotalea sp. Y01 TaxID=2729613 RepID=UPI00145DB714|nr:hypothetical protein [Thalassotalea sp. Y01]NMP17904.1 hypothetical protein [Thalassotalea sp. Y01]